MGREWFNLVLKVWLNWGSLILLACVCKVDWFVVNVLLALHVVVGDVFCLYDMLGQWTFYLCVCLNVGGWFGCLVCVKVIDVGLIIVAFTCDILWCGWFVWYVWWCRSTKWTTNVMNMLIALRRRRCVNLESCIDLSSIIMNDVYLFVMFFRCYFVIAAKQSLSVL